MKLYLVSAMKEEKIPMSQSQSQYGLQNKVNKEAKTVSCFCYLEKKDTYVTISLGKQGKLVAKD
jgi:hypothetical protein